MRRIALVMRPQSEEVRRAEVDAAVAALRASGHDVAVHMTGGDGDDRRYARAASLDGCDVVVAAGGDGTVNGVVNGLVDAAGAAPASAGAALAVVPMGTANDFARGLDLPSSLHDALQVAAEGRPAQFDTGRVNGLCFINVSTGGFGADATQAASRGAKRLLGPLAYLVEGARRLISFDPGRALFRIDGETVHDGQFIFFAVGNSAVTGGGTRIAPRADPADGRLDVVLVCGSSRLDFLSLLPDLRVGTHLEGPDVSYFHARTVEVRSDRTVPVNADGESIDGSVFTYDVLDRPLTVMVPA
ncbi:lipid kinase YegS [soil metagenome]